jgi:predicted DCC family thiol-disulfide oxidoreductase YuxK
VEPNYLPDRVVLIFDGSCGFCTRSARWVRAIDRLRRVTALPFQQPGVLEAHGLTVAECEAAAWAIAPGHSPQRGAAAVMLALSIALGSRIPWVIYQLPVLQRVQDAVYALVARYRHRLPGDKPYCEQFPAECGEPNPPGADLIRGGENP